jgi:hypothetical protein
MHKKSLVTVIAVSLLLLDLSAVTFESVNSAITKPSVPEFILTSAQEISTHPATYKTDPYTGAQVIDTPAYQYVTTRVYIKIKNQLFTPYTDSNGNYTQLYFNVRTAGHFNGVWYEQYNSDPGSVSFYPTQSSSEYTTLTLDLLGNFSSGSMLDVQVETMIGYFHEELDTLGTSLHGYATVFHGETSDWSSTQTVTLAESTQTVAPSSGQSTSPTANPPYSSTNSSATQAFGLDAVGNASLVVLVIIAVLLVFVVFYLRKRNVSGSIKNQTVREDSAVQ